MYRISRIFSVLSIATLAVIASAGSAAAVPLPHLIQWTAVTVPTVDRFADLEVDTKDVERALKNAGIPVGPVDGEYDNETRRGICLWRELTGDIPKFSLPTNSEEIAIATGMFTLEPSRKMIAGLNVNITCQGATWVTLDEENQVLEIQAVFPVTTGGPSTPTRTGTHTLYRETNAWHESTEYAGSWMYKPKYFSRGQALHGSRNDAWLTTNPDTYGCVRMLQKDMDLLWKSRFSIGEQIRVYGEWAAWEKN